MTTLRVGTLAGLKLQKTLVQAAISSVAGMKLVGADRTTTHSTMVHTSSVAGMKLQRATASVRRVSSIAGLKLQSQQDHTIRPAIPSHLQIRIY